MNQALNRAAGDPKEVTAVCFGDAAAALGDVRGD